MPSANGWRLQVRGHSLVASWQAPFFVLVDGWMPGDELDDKPALIHCENREHAERAMEYGGMLLDSEFIRIK